MGTGLGLVVEKGADINLHTPELPSPLCFALVQGGQPECARWLLSLNPDVTIGHGGISPMCYAASSGLVDIMEILLEKGAVLTLDKYITTPLHAAAGYCKIEALKFVLDKGVDVNMKEPNGETALTVSAKHPEVVEILMSKGAKIDISKPIRRRNGREC